MAKIYAPNKEYTGITATVRFAGGVGESSDPYLLKWFTDHGYTVAVEETPKAEKEETPKAEKEETPKAEKKGK